MTASQQERWIVKTVRSPSGFTLVEALIASSIGALILGAITTTYIISLRGLTSISNYVEIHSDGRTAIDYFARDMRAANNLASFTASSYLRVTVPTNVTNSGSITATKTITYQFNNGGFYRTDYGLGKTSLLATNITSVLFTLYDRAGSTNGVIAATAKGIQIDIKLRKMNGSRTNSEDYLSARLIMRNVP